MQSTVDDSDKDVLEQNLTYSKTKYKILQHPKS